jgi:tRNA(Ile)-lysidine synthase
MASSRKLKLSSLPIRVEEILRGQIEPGNHLIVALSGGMDSVVLIDLLSKLSAKMQFTLSAVHIDHGISVNSNGWTQFSRKLCRSLSIPLKTTKLKLKRGPGVNLESVARDARYQVFSSLRADYVVLAQHLDDQAETLLLQLLRGSGARGLSAMPMVRSQSTGIGDHASTPSPRILRPLLEIPQSEIESYAEEHQLSWIIDESNADTSFDRNFLRHEILPILGERFPSYRTTFMRTSRHLSEASSLMDELAESDSERCTLSGKIQVEGLRTLTLPRAKNLLR